MDRRALALFLVLLSIALFMVSMQPVRHETVLTFFRFDFENNRWVVRSWPYVQRGGPVCVTCPGMSSQYPNYHWHSAGTVYAPLGRSFYAFYAEGGYFTICSSGSCTAYLAICENSSTGTLSEGSLSPTRGHCSSRTLSDYPEDYKYRLGWSRKLRIPVPTPSGDTVRSEFIEWPDNSYGVCQTPPPFLVGWDAYGNGSAEITAEISSDIVYSDIAWGYRPDHGDFFSAARLPSACYSNDEVRYEESGPQVRATSMSDDARLVASTVYRGPCGLPVVIVGTGDRYILKSFEMNGDFAVPVFGPRVSFDTRGFFFYLPGRQYPVCLLSNGVYYDPFTGESGRLPPPPVSIGYSPFFAYVDFNGQDYYVLAGDLGSVYYSFSDRDGDGVPDFKYLSLSNQYDMEFEPVVLTGVDFNEIPVVPRGIDNAVLHFRLAGSVYPGARVTFQNVSVSVDGNPAGSVSDPFVDYVEYNFSYGTHSICYSFDVVNGQDTDHYSRCYTVEIGYEPWNVSFGYQQEGNVVRLVASAEDDGRIVKYIWDIDGNHIEANSPVLEYSFDHPGDYNVCLTVVDDTNVAVRVCGVVTVSSKLVPSGVMFVDRHRMYIEPEPVPETPAPRPSGLSVAHVTVAVSFALLIVAILVVVL